MPATYTLEELANLPEFYHPKASPGGDRVAFYYDESGRNELHVLDVESGERRQVSDGEVPRSARHPIRWAPDGERVYFHRDASGDEQNDIYAIGLDDGVEPVVETAGQCNLQDVRADGTLLYTSTESGQLNLHAREPGGETRQLTTHDQPVWNAGYGPAGERVAYTANESEDRENRDVYVMRADGSGARKLAVGDDGYEATFADWSPEGAALLVGDNTADTNRCGVYDLASDGLAWFGDGEYEEYPLAFLPDGERVVALRTHEAAVLPVVYDRDGGVSELELPTGFATVPARDSAFLDADTVLVAHATSNRREELLAYDLATDATETLLPAAYGDVDPDAFVEAEYVTYESTDGLEIGALCYDSGERPSPAVVMVHGGPHAQSYRTFSQYAQFLVGQGYTVFQPNYRGSTGRGREFKNAIHGDWGGAEADDIAEAGRWLQARDWVDEDRVAVFGGSYGGYSAFVQLVNYPTLWATGIAWIGITDLHALYEESMPHFQAILREQMGDPEENRDLWRERSPVTHVDRMERPVFVIHGANDPRCPVSQARLFRDALEQRGWERGVEFEYEEFGDEGHGSTDIDQKVRVFRLLADYLDRRL